jgi:MinD-like ATPase involved in chromosome partitioning or flagellar assembly
MIAQSVAELIAKEKKEILVLFAALNGRKSTEYMKEEVVTIDEYKIQLKSGIGIDKNSLNPNRKMDNLYVIGGVEKEEETRYFLPDMVDVLVDSLDKKFDLLIFDSGSDIDNGLAFGALTMDNQKYLVFEQSESSIRRYEKIREIYGKLNIEFDKYILNKYVESDPLTIKYIASRLGLDNNLFIAVDNSDRSRVSEIEYKTLLDTANDKYKNDILNIANDIMKTMCMENIRLKRKSVWNVFM